MMPFVPKRARRGGSRRCRCVVLHFLLCFLLCFLVGCEVVAYSNMSEKDINEMVALLRNNDVDAQKVSQGKGLWSLNVPDAELARALDTLRANGLPRAQHQGLGSVFKKEGMVSTPTEEQARLLFALSEELSATISGIDGVLDARVHVVLPKLDNFGAKLTSSTASVFIRHRHDVDMQEHLGSVKRLVEHAVPDLQYDAITVSLFPSEAKAQMRAPSGRKIADKLDLGSMSAIVGAAVGAVVSAIVCSLIFVFTRRKRGAVTSGEAEKALQSTSE